MSIIFTDHVRSRMRLRGISEKDVRQAILRSDSHFKLDEGKEKYIRTLDKYPLHVIVKHNQLGETIVLSAWLRGEDDPLPLWWRIIRLPFVVLWFLLKPRKRR